MPTPSFQFRITDPRDPVTGFFAVLGPSGSFGRIHFDALKDGEEGLDLVHVWAAALADAVQALFDGKSYFARDPDSPSAGLVLICDQEGSCQLASARFSGDGKNSGELHEAAPWAVEEELWSGPKIELVGALRNGLEHYLADANGQIPRASLRRVADRLQVPSRGPDRTE